MPILSFTPDGFAFTKLLARIFTLMGGVSVLAYQVLKMIAILDNDDPLFLKNKLNSFSINQYLRRITLNSAKFISDQKIMDELDIHNLELSKIPAIDTINTILLNKPVAFVKLHK